MEVIGNSQFLIRQIERLRRVAQWLAPFQPAFLVASVAAWGILAWLLWQGQLAFANWSVGAVAILSALALGLPHWVDGLSAEIQSHARHVEARRETEALLRTLLDEQWTLYQNVLLPDVPTPLDGILVGSGGVFLLSIVQLSGTYQNSGDKWLRRAADDDWEVAKFSPTRHITEQAGALTAWLRAQEIDVTVKPRLIWAGSGLILQEQPDVPFWLLNHGDAVGDELRHSADAISAETQARLRAKLKSLISAAEQLPLTPHVR